MSDEFEVRLTQSDGPVMLTDWIPRDSLSFRSIDPGGFGSVSFDLSRELDARDFEANAEIAVFDAETGEQVGGGRLLNPGRGLSSSGEVWKMSALGEGPAHLAEHKTPYHLIDTRMDDGTWYRGFRNSKRFEFNNSNHPDDESLPGWLFTTPEGKGWAATHGCSLNYYDVEQYGLAYGAKIAAFSVTHDMGRSTSNQVLRAILASYGGVGGNEEVSTGTGWSWSTTPATRTRKVTSEWAATGIGTSDDLDPVRLILRVQREASAADVAEPPGALSTDWAHLSNLRVSCMRLDRNGNEITTAAEYQDPWVLAHDVIIDLWARFAPRLDLVNARIDETSTFHFKDMVWPDGVTPYEVMARLMEFDPAFTWAVWEKQANGLWRAEWRERDTDVRYELDAEDGFDQTGDGAAELDAVFVVATNKAGRYRIQGHGEYGEAVHSRSDTIRYSEGTLDDTDFNADASELGETALHNSQLRASSAKVTVARKVYDHYTGRWVKPFQVLPGYLARVRGVRSVRDTLNDTAGVGAAVFRVASNDYSAGRGSADLELNAYTFDELRAIEQLMNQGA